MTEEYRVERAVLMNCYAELVIQDLHLIQFYYELFEVPEPEREDIGFFIQLARGYAVRRDDESVVHLLQLEDQVSKVVEYFRSREAIEEDMLQLLR